MTFWLSIASLVVSLVVPAAIFVARNWLLARITKGVEHQFNVKIEGVRADLRKNEEHFKSELRDKEAEISALRTNVLGGSANRQGLLDKRRFEAVERVWIAVNDLAPLKNLSAYMAVLNMKAISEEVHDPKMQRFLSVLDKIAPNPAQLKNAARDERPFLPDLTWAYFNAYHTIVLSGLLRLNAFKLGIENPERFMKWGHLKDILKATLPHHSEWIDQNEPESFYYLLDELEQLLLTELRKVLEGKEADHASVERAKQIMDVLKEGEKAQAKAAATSSAQAAP